MLLYIIQSTESKAIKIASSDGDLFRQFLLIIEANCYPVELLKVLDCPDSRLMDILRLACQDHTIHHDWYHEPALAITLSRIGITQDYQDVTSAFKLVFDYESQEGARDSLEAMLL